MFITVHLIIIIVTITPDHHLLICTLQLLTIHKILIQQLTSSFIKHRSSNNNPLKLITIYIPNEIPFNSIEREVNPKNIFSLLINDWALKTDAEINALKSSKGDLQWETQKLPKTNKLSYYSKGAL